MLSFPHQPSPWLSLLVPAIALNTILFFVPLIYGGGNGQIDRNAEFEIGSEYPLLLPNVLVTMEDTDKFAIYGPQANAEWFSTTPADEGYIRLGKEHRVMGLSFGHEIHCLQVLRIIAAYPLHPDAKIEHVHHCINYLRLYILCDPNLTLERFDPLEGNFTLPRFGATHVCRDWRVAYDELARAYERDTGLFERNYTSKDLP